MILETPRLILRPLRRDDAEALHGLMSDPEVMAYWDIAAIEDFDLTKAILASQIQAMALEAACHWAVLRAADQIFVGACDVSDIEPWHKRGEIGFISARAYWGEGYMFEAMRAVVDYAAQTLRLKRLAARAHLGNQRSTRLLERLGFAPEGVLRGHVERDGERRDCQLFGLLL